MTPDQAKNLGQYLRNARTAAGLSVRQLEAVCGIHNSLLTRMEQGAIANPAPDKLRRLAEALQLPLADLYALADYLVADELPGLSAYLRLKYRELPPELLNTLQVEVDAVLAQHVNSAAPAAAKKPTKSRRSAASEGR